MKLFLNILLGLLSAACAAALLLQGFVIPDLGFWPDLALRIGVAVFAQSLMLRVSKKKLVRYIPLILTAIAAVWGFFLLLTSPSWRGATVGGFFYDYVTFFGACGAVCLLVRCWPWIKGKFRQLRKHLRRRKQQKKNKDVPHS